MEIAETAYKPALVVDGTGRQVRDPVRTAEEATIHWLIENPAVHALNRRLGALSGTGAEQGEALQILRYRPGQQYRSHVDWDGGDNRRVLTALVYLNEGYGGGETQFVATPEEAGALLEELARPGDRVLVKGSRSVGLERVLS